MPQVNKRIITKVSKLIYVPITNYAFENNKDLLKKDKNKSRVYMIDFQDFKAHSKEKI